MEQKKCHVKRPDDCKKGDHNFVVSRWLVSMAQHSASGFTCTRCLFTVDGKLELDKLRAQIDERDLPEDTERSKPAPRSKAGKGVDREAQETGRPS